MYPYQNPDLTPEERTRDLLSRMTAEEKIAQLSKGRMFDQFTVKDGVFEICDELKEKAIEPAIGTLYGLLRADWWTKKNRQNGLTGDRAAQAANEVQKLVLENSRLGIPILFVEEAPHGMEALDATIFPTGLGLGASFDKELMYRIGKVIGDEAAAAGISSVYGPILDLAIDPRWSRVEECFSENAFHVSRLAESMVRGIRSTGTEPTLKHYVGGGHSESGHNAKTVHLGPMELFNQDIRPFRDCIRAGAKMLMATYHDVDGEPCTGSKYLLTDILRGQLGFDGFVTADGGAVECLHWNWFCTSRAEAGAMALKAGCDGESGHDTLAACGQNLREAYAAGLITDADLDLAAGRLLKIKFELGLFEHPYAKGDPASVFSCPAHLAVAKEAGDKALVLLKNNGILPLSNTVRSIAVIGPNADHVMNMLGDYTAEQQPGVIRTILEGMKTACAERSISIRYVQGCWIRKKDRSRFAEAVKLAKESDVVLFVPGGSSTRFDNVKIDPATGAPCPTDILDGEESEKECGEGTDRCTLDLSGVQLELFRELAATGKPVVTVPVLGRPLLMEELMEKSAALICAWYPGMCGGDSVADALFGKCSPSGRLPVSLPQNAGQLPVSSLNPSANYCDGSGKAFLPFGYGLHYTTFEYSGLNVNGRTVSVTIKNTGKMASDETVLFFLHKLASPVRRGYRELFDFCRIHLVPGESTVVTTEVPEESLGHYDRNGIFRKSSESFQVYAGPNPDSQLESDVITPIL